MEKMYQNTIYGKIEIQQFVECKSCGLLTYAELVNDNGFCETCLEKTNNDVSTRGQKEGVK
jgi:formylmethanofuran dehydrogenase subunit E